MDITKQIEVEKELIESEKHLLRRAEDIALSKYISQKIELSEKKFRNIFETSRDAIVLLNEDGFFDCNQAALDLFKISKSDLLKAHPGDISPPKQTDGNDSYGESEKLIQKAFIEKLPIFEWVHKRSDGSEFPAEILLSPIDIGEKPSLQAVLRDISERNCFHSGNTGSFDNSILS